MAGRVTQMSTIYHLPPSAGGLPWCKIPPESTNSSNPEAYGSETFDNLLPTLIECFAIVFCGYLAGRYRLISGSEIKGLNDFTSMFSLPALIYLNLSTIELNSVNWNFISGILLGKVLVFLLVVGVTLTIQKPINLAYAGLYGVFCTQGNDFGLGYPVVASLYGKSHPLYAGYMYLIAPTSLIVTNPLGFLLMEAEKARSGEKWLAEKTSTFRKVTSVLKSVLWGIFKNPNVFVTMLGILGNFAFQGRLPSFIYGILQILAAAFSASVLFLLGFSVVGSGRHMRGVGLLLPGVLLAVKMVVSPLITRAMVEIQCSSAPDVQDLANYGFLYGIVPTGPIVMLFAADYGLRADTLATAMVISTLLFGPTMYVLAKMVVLKVYGVMQYSGYLKDTLLSLGIIGLISALLVLLMTLASRKWKRPLYQLTLCLLAAQLVTSAGIVAWALVKTTDLWFIYLQTALITGGHLATRIWTAILAVALVFLQNRPSAYGIKIFCLSLTVGYGLAAAVVAALLSLMDPSPDDLTKNAPVFIYGKIEATAAAVVLSVCLGVTLASLVLYTRAHSARSSLDNNSRRQSLAKIQDIPIDDSIPRNTEIQLTPTDLLNSADLAISKMAKHSYVDPKNGDTPMNKEEFSDSQEEQLDGVKLDMNGRKLETSFSIHSASSYSLDIKSVTTSDSSTESDLDEVETKPKHLRHMILLILLCISMSVGLTVSVWKLIADEASGLFVAMEFLDAVLNFGQAAFTVIVFRSDIKYILDILLKWGRRLRHKAGWVDLTPVDGLDQDSKQLCYQFLTYHYDNCAKELPRDINWRQKTRRDVFRGREFVDWLSTVGLTVEREDGERYGQRLLRGGVIQSVAGKDSFVDGQHLFFLSPKNIVPGSETGRVP